MTLELLVALVLLALVFDFLNGFHDAANSIATVVSTGVLRPMQAVAWAAFFNAVAYFLFPLDVAATIGKGIVDGPVLDHVVIAAALFAAIFWNLLTWYYGMPTSSSHALIGGLIGAAVVKAGGDGLVAHGVMLTLAFVVLSPLLGYLIGGLAMVGVAWACRHRSERWVNRRFRPLQLLSAAAYSLGHGANDAQKTAGIIWMLLLLAATSVPDLPPWLHTDAAGLPFWVLPACHVVIAAGTLFGGWRIVRTMGERITRLTPVGGCCAETGGALTLFLATHLGAPVSTTLTITGAIAGVGATRRGSPVRGRVMGSIVIAWALTVPCTAFVAAVAWFAAQRLM